MPVHQASYTLGTASPTLIVGRATEPQQVWVHEADHSESTEAYLGNASVTAANGLHLHAAETLAIVLQPSDELYAISGQGAPTLNVLKVTKH